MAETTTKANPKKAATKTPVASAKPAAEAKPISASAKPTAEAKPAIASAKPASVKAVVANVKAVEKEAEVAKKPVAAKVNAAKPATKSENKVISVSDEQRYRMIADAAYYRAESTQFKSDPVRDWIDAESEISALLNASK